MYIRWYAENMWLFVPVQQKLQQFFKGFMEYPYQLGSSLSAANFSYQTLKLAEARGDWDSSRSSRRRATERAPQPHNRRGIHLERQVPRARTPSHTTVRTPARATG
jgi:hypothetical protein